jgi:membrane-bound metal-dependent hydrolase YbcI (DUF457 family)
VDNVTHTLFALTLARTPLGRAGRGATAALVLASNAPDIDIISAARRGAVDYLIWHRGPTHGPLGILGLGVAAAGLVWAALQSSARLRPRPPAIDGAHDRDRAAGANRAQGSDPADASLGMLVAVSMIGVLLHVLMDLPTSYGTRLFSPFDWHWYAVDWLPIIDIYLLIALAAGLVFGRTSAASRRRNAAIVLVLMAANYGVRAIAHHQALALVPRLFGPTLPRRCEPAPETASVLDAWPRAAPAVPPAPPASRCLIEIAAMPTFLSPFKWRVIAQMSNAYEVHDVDTLDARFRSAANESEAFWRRALRYPNVWTPAVEKAALSHLGQTFLGFSRFPAARWVVDRHGITTVRWTDMRFAAGLIALEQPVRRPNPFSAIVRLDADGRILEESLGR